VSEIKITQRKLLKIFSRIFFKLNFNLTNNTETVLSLELLPKQEQKKLLEITAAELQNFLTKNKRRTSTNLLSGKSRLKVIVNRCYSRFLFYRLGNTHNSSIDPLYENHLVQLFTENEELFLLLSVDMISLKSKTLLQNVFSSTILQDNSILFENLIEHNIIRISEIVSRLIFLKFENFPKIRKELYSQKFLSYRTFENFKNNILWQNYFNYYIKKPSNLYDNKTALWVLSKKGIAQEWIYLDSSQDLKSLEKIQLFIILLIEIKDFGMTRLSVTGKSFKNFILTKIL